MEKDAIAKDKVNLRPRVIVKPNGAATVNAAYRFQTPPGPPPMPVVPVVARTNVAVHRVCSIKDTESENTMLDVDLDNAAIIIKAIHGPEVTKVIGTLGERPHELSLDGDVFSAISKEKDAIAVAMQEVATVSSLSQHIKDAADERLQVLRDGLAKLELKAHGSVDCANADLAFSTLDKARANAVAQKDAWVSRVSKRKQAVFEETMHAIKAIGDTEQALALQKVMLQEKLEQHQLAWDEHNDLIKNTFLDKITRLTQQCEDASQAVMTTSDAPNVSALQQMVTALQAQLASQVDVMAAADLRYQQMEARLAAFLPPTPLADTADGSVPTAAGGAMDISASGEDASVDITATPAGDEPKGLSKGKGKSSGHGHY